MAARDVEGINMMGLIATTYTRVSTGKQADGTSLEKQDEACERMASVIGATVTYRRSDPGVSGELFEARPGIQDAIADIEQGRSHVLIIFNNDRSARNLDVARLIARRVTEAGGRLFFTDEGEIIYRGVGKGLYSMKALFAEMEKEAIFERTSNGKMRRVKGDPLRGVGGVQVARAMRPYGYDIVTRDNAHLFPGRALGSYVIREDEARWVREIYTRFSVGSSLRQIATFLREAGVPPPSASEDRAALLAKKAKRPAIIWYPNSIRDIIKNPVYQGEATYGKRRRVVDEKRITQTSERSGKKYKRVDYNVRVSEDKWVRIAHDSPIVSRETWALCQTRLTENREKNIGNPKRAYMLTGLLRCPVCGGSMVGKKARGGRKPNLKYHTYYLCRRYAPSTNAQGEVCNPTNYRADALEPLVVKGIREVAASPALIEVALEAHRLSERSEEIQTVRLADLRAELSQLAAREAAIVEAEIEARVEGRSTAVYAGKLADLTARRVELEAAIQVAAERETQSVPEPKNAAAILAQALADIEVALTDEEVTPAEKYSLLARVVEEVRPEGEGVVMFVRPLPSGGHLSRGVQRIVILRWGNSKPELRMADRTRSLLSCTAASGRPTSDHIGTEVEMSTSTVTE